MQGWGCLLRAVVVLVPTLVWTPSLRAQVETAADPALRSYLSANGLLNRGMYELAAEEYAAFLREHGSHEKTSTARYGLAVCRARLGQPDAALAELQQLTSLEGFAFEAEVWTLLAQCHLARQEMNEAVEACAHVVREHPEHALADDAAALCAEALCRSGRHADTAKWCVAFEKRWADSPLLVRVRYFLGLAQLAGDQLDDAITTFTGVVERAPKSSQGEHAALLLAQCHHRRNALAEAVTWYERVVEGAEGRYVAEALLGLARVAHAQSRLDEADALLTRLLKRADAGELANAGKLERARVWFDQAKYADALQLCEELPQEGDLADDAAYWAAKCRLRQEAYEDAAARLARALGRFDQSELRAEMQFDRGVALLRLERLDEAREVLGAFQKQHGQHELAAEALYLTAVIAHRQERYGDSLSQCELFMKDRAKHPRAGQVRLLAAENEYLAGHYQEALRAYTRLENDQRDVMTAEQFAERIGMTLYRLGRLDEAAERLAKLTEAKRTEAAFRPALLALGEIAFGRSEWKLAEERFRAYLGAAPDAAGAEAARFKLGLALQRQEQHAAALDVLDEWLSRHAESPQRTHAVFERGQALLALDRPDEAQAAFEQVLKADDAERFAPHARMHLGMIALRQERYGDAAVLFERVLESDGDEALAASALELRGQALLTGGQHAEAKQALRLFLRRYGDDARVPAVRARLAIACARQGQLDEALEAAAPLAENDWDGIDGALRAAAIYEYAWCLRKLDRGEEAGVAYRRLSKEHGTPLRLHALLELAEMEAGAKRYAAAVVLLQQLRSAGADLPAELRGPAMYRLGVCQFELGQNQVAAETLEEFLREHADSKLTASASFFCGEACFRERQHERAGEHFRRVVEKHADDETCGPSLLRLGESLAAVQHWAASEAAFTDFLERFADDPQWFQAQFGVGWARENQGRQEEAIAAYRKVTERHQGETAARAQFQIGECLFAQKQPADAVRELLKVDILYAYPQWSAAALYEAGRCLESAGKTVEARQQYRAVVDKHAETRWGQLAQQRLAAAPVGAPPGRGPQSSEQ